MSKNAREELKKYLDSQLANFGMILNSISETNLNKPQIQENNIDSKLNRIKTNYKIICKATYVFGQYFIGNNIINPTDRKSSADQALHKCCHSIQEKIDKIINLAQTATTSAYEHHLQEFEKIHYLVHIMDEVMKIGENFISCIDKARIIDNIIVNTLEYLRLSPAMNDLQIVLNEMKWMTQYHSSKHGLASMFESRILQWKIDSLNQSI